MGQRYKETLGCKALWGIAVCKLETSLENEPASFIYLPSRWGKTQATMFGSYWALVLAFNPVFVA